MKITPAYFNNSCFGTVLDCLALGYLVHADTSLCNWSVSSRTGSLGYKDFLNKMEGITPLVKWTASEKTKIVIVIDYKYQLGQVVQKA